MYYREVNIHYRLAREYNQRGESGQIDKDLEVNTAKFISYLVSMDNVPKDVRK